MAGVPVRRVPPFPTSPSPCGARDRLVHRRAVATGDPIFAMPTGGSARLALAGGKLYLADEHPETASSPPRRNGASAYPERCRRRRPRRGGHRTRGPSFRRSAKRMAPQRLLIVDPSNYCWTFEHCSPCPRARPRRCPGTRGTSATSRSGSRTLPRPPSTPLCSAGIYEQRSAEAHQVEARSAPHRIPGPGTAGSVLCVRGPGGRTPPSNGCVQRVHAGAPTQEPGRSAADCVDTARGSPSSPLWGDQPGDGCW